MPTTQTRPVADADPITPRRSPWLRRIGMGLGLLVMIPVAVIAYSEQVSRSAIADHEDRVVDLAGKAGPVQVDEAAIADLPEPVQRWVSFTFDDPAGVRATHIEIGMEGDFRRPLTEGFNNLTGSTVSATNEAAFVFSGKTSVFPGVWALAYDAYAKGEMEMKAKVMSTLTVVDEQETPELNRSSLQRWLLLSPTYPSALLPGGLVTWEPIDGDHARATVRADGLEASLRFTFGDDGQVEEVNAETDGDLTTPYHGSGEHVTVTDYREVSGMMVPHQYVVARAADGERFPFLTGIVTEYKVYG